MKTFNAPRPPPAVVKELYHRLTWAHHAVAVAKNTTELDVAVREREQVNAQIMEITDG